MTITYPLDLLTGFPGTSTRFDPEYMLELDGTRAGKSIAKDLGPELWHATFATRELKPSELRYWKARMQLLEGGKQAFVGYDMTACYPLAYPRGTWPTGDAFNGIANLFDVDTDTNKRMRLSALPVGYRVSVGDYVSYDYANGLRALHRAVEEATADGSGITPFFEVRPHIRQGVDLDSDGAEVSLIKPHCLMVMIPGSLSTDSDKRTGRGAVSFSARQKL
jgi:hypothetical protein